MAATSGPRERWRGSRWRGGASQRSPSIAQGTGTRSGAPATRARWRCWYPDQLRQRAQVGRGNARIGGMARGGGRRAIRLGIALRLALPLLVALALTARVSAADDEADGRRLFHRGEQFLKVGDYRSAAAAFEAG